MKQNETEDIQLDDFEELDFGGVKETEEKITYVENNLWAKLQTAGKKISFAKDIIALFNYMRDPFVSWHRKAIVVAALIYFISPIDTVPDIAPLIGYLDDLGVITALMKYLGSELSAYYDPAFRA